MSQTPHEDLMGPEATVDQDVLDADSATNPDIMSGAGPAAAGVAGQDLMGPEATVDQDVLDADSATNPDIMS